MDLGKTETWIEHWEGRRNQTYTDTAGHPTVGVGFNLDANGARDRIAALGLDYDQVRSGVQSLTDARIDTLFDQSLNQAVHGAREVIPSFDALPDDKQIVIIDMVFNLGVGGFREFVHAIQAINNQDWATAAQQMQQSAWFHQVRARASADVNVMSGAATTDQAFA